MVPPVNAERLILAELLFVAVPTGNTKLVDAVFIQRSNDPTIIPEVYLNVPSFAVPVPNVIVFTPVLIFPEAILNVSTTATLLLMVTTPAPLTAIVLKVSPLAFVMPLAAPPMKSIVELLCVKVPVLTQFPSRLTVSFRGPTSVPEMVILLNEVFVVPEIVSVPLNSTVPELCANVPLFTQFLAMFMVPAGAVRVPLITTSKKDVVEDPLTVVVKLKSIAPLLCVKVPLFTQLPLTRTVSLSIPRRVPVIVTLLKIV
ncbi:MAG: hypothetical protein JKY18_10820 [Flavobacteriales bacterium]|nr:hypothetical protein [Flavobacteriales bacterium]